MLRPSDPKPPTPAGERKATPLVIIVRTNKGMFDELVKCVVRRDGSGASRWNSFDRKMSEFLLLRFEVANSRTKP